MPAKIEKITDVDPSDYPFYLLDSNVWIATLKSFNIGENALESKDRAYCNFVDAIISLNEQNDPKALKKIKNQPKFIIINLLLSEVINAYLRNVAMRMYFGGGREYRTYNFKNDYRDNPSTNYNERKESLIDDFMSHSDYFEFWDDDFRKIIDADLLRQLPANTDYNDYYFYKFAVKQNIPVVSDDADFAIPEFKELHLITNNPKILPK